MAPSPVLNEPKGPDKNSEKCPDDGSEKDKQNISSDNVDSCSKDESTAESININEIGEGELKSLLDEAYNFRSPKDREGKSSLFQKFLNEVEESDAAKKKLIDQSRGFVDGLKAASAIESGHHDSVSDQSFLSNILGGSDKKKKKSSKRDGSNSNGSSRRSKFQHSLKITSGPQTSVYNGNVGAAGNGSNNNNASGGSGNSNNGSNGGANSSYHSSSRGASRTQQSLSTRLNTPAKPATLLTSSSNIDIPMVTTYNKQPIMTPAVVPRKQQQKAEIVLLDRGNAASDTNSNGDETSGKNEDIELKSLNEIEIGGCNYTARASLEIDGNVSKEHVDAEDIENDNNGNKYGSLMDDGPRSCAAKAYLLLQTSSLVNGNAELPSQRSAVYKPFNGALDNKEEDNGNSVLELDDATMINKMKSEISSTDVVMANGTSSVDEAKTRLLQNKVQNVQSIWTTMYPLNAPFLILNSADSLHKESLESRKSGDEGMNNYQMKDGRTGRSNKKKVKKPDVSYLSENIEGHCGDRDIEYLLTYIEENRSSSSIGGGGNANSHSINGTANHPKSPRTKQPTTNGGNVKYEKQARGKACTDEDIRSNKKPVAKAKERLKKSTSLEDLRHSSKPAKSNKKQSSVDDNQYETAKTKSSSPVPTSLPPSTKKAVTCELPAPIAVEESVDSKRLYYDSPVDDSYTDEFHLVTKKQRKKKRRSKSRNADQKSSSSVTAAARASMSHGFLPHNYTDRGYDNGGGGGFKRSTRSTENRHRSRRKSVSSVVPSDKISDSDSIHSLPVSSTTPKHRIKKKSTSSGCTPQASYADIAKSPQCQGSMILNGDSTTTAKWQTTKTFSNVSSSSSSSSTNASGGHSTNVESANTVDSPDPADNVELVSSTKYEDHVEVDDGCDQLLLSKNLSSNSCLSSDSAAATEPAVGEAKNLDNNDDCCNINDSNNNTGNNINRIGVTIKRKNKSNKCNESDDNINVNNNNNNNDDSCSTNTNSYSHVCLNGKLDKSTVKEGLNTSTDTNNINNNHNSVNSNNSSKTKKSKSKKKTTAEEHEVTTDQHNIDGGNGEKNSNDLFIEFTVAAPSVKTKCSQTQTDLVEVNNNGCGNDVTVEETVILKNNRNSGSATQDGSSFKLKKLSVAADGAVGDGNRVIVLPSQAAGAKGGNTITVGFEVDTKLLDEAAAVSGDQRRTEMLKETIERSSRYNVKEVVQMVQSGWKEVMDKMSSAAIKVQYYKPE